MASVDVGVTSRVQAAYSNYPEKLRLVASDPVASAFVFHATIDAVLKCLLQFGASDGGGGLGRVKGYVGMVEEQRRLSSLPPFRVQRLQHFPRSYRQVTGEAHQACPVFGTNHLQQSDYFLRRDPRLPRSRRHAASFALCRDIIYCEFGSTATSRQGMPRYHTSPPRAWFPRHGAERCRLHDSSFSRLVYLDLAELTLGANLRKCQPTCHKYIHRDSCRRATVSK